MFLTPRFPWPLIGGDRVKSYFLLKHLALHHEVTLVTFNHGGPPTNEQVDAIEALGVDLHTIPLSAPVAGLSSARTLWTDLPLEIAFYTRPEMRRHVDELIAERSFDVGISFFMRTAQYIRNNHTMAKILVAEDCRTQYMSRSSSSSRTFLQRTVRWWETKKLQTYEPKVVEDFHLTTFVSPQDVAAMNNLNGSAQYRVVTNGVDLDRFAFVDDHQNRTGMLFSGKMDLLANQLMVKQILESVYPVIRQHVPNAQLTIAGANPPSSMGKNLPPGVSLHADVPDMVPYLHGHAVFVHPHHGGSGIQNKVLEAMASGCAVVTTTSGLQGIEAVHGEHCLVGSTPAELAEMTAGLLSDPDQRRRLATNARALMEETHSWAVVNDQISAAIATVLNRNSHL